MKPECHLLAINTRWGNTFADKLCWQKVLQHLLCPHHLPSSLPLVAPLFRARCLLVTMIEPTQKRKERKSSLMKCLAVCVPSQFISLSWVNSRCVKKRLLRAVTATSKMRHTLQEEYEILINLVRLRIGSPQLQRWELHCSLHPRLTPGLWATLCRASSHFSQQMTLD